MMVGRRCFPVEIVPFQVILGGVRCPNGEGMVLYPVRKKHTWSYRKGQIPSCWFCRDHVSMWPFCCRGNQTNKQTNKQTNDAKCCRQFFQDFFPPKIVPLLWVGVMTFHDTCHDITNWMVQEIPEKSSWGTSKKAWIILGGVELLIDLNARYTKKHFVSLGSFP